MEFIVKYGYLAVFLGSLVEGESVILTAGALAYQGYLSLWGIMAVAFMGTLIADQALFQVGRLYGQQILNRWPSLKKRSEKAFRLLHRYNTLYILSFRFIYGIRVVSPLIIGMSGVGTKRFSVLNVIAAGIWSVLSCLAGYMIGKFGVELWHAVKAGGLQALLILLIVVAVMGLSFFFCRWFRHRRP